MSTLPYKRIGFLGVGEIGKAISGLYKGTEHKLFFKDIDKSDFNKDKPLDILHVCIPGNSGKFISVVVENIKEYCPDGLVIIHSTVPVGVTEFIQDRFKFVVHSPVRGKHPDLLPSLTTFVKYIGADFAGAGRFASEHLESLGIKTKVLHKSRTTELLKLLSTTYYAHCIAFHDYANKICEKEGLNFDALMSHANNTYNEGYLKMGMPDFIRPILSPTEEGIIGGHCLMPNIEILRDQFGPHPLIDHLNTFKDDNTK